MIDLKLKVKKSTAEYKVKRKEHKRTASGIHVILYQFLYRFLCT